MASSNVIADFAKRPPAFKAGVFLGIAVALGALYYQLVFSGVQREIKAAEDRRASLALAEDKASADEKEYKTKKAQKDELDLIIAENASALPTASQLPGFFDMLNLQVKEAQVEVRRWDYQKELPVEDFFKVSVEIEIAGTFYEIEKFFYLLYKMSQKEDAPTTGTPTPTPAPTDPVAPPTTDLPATKLSVEERGRILTIENLVIDKPEIVDNELILTATFRASTFRQEPKVEDEEAAAAKAKKDKAAKDKAAKAKATKDKAGAQKSAPADAKDKAQDAADKSDSRVRDSVGSDAELPAERDDQPDGVDGVKKGM